MRRFWNEQHEMRAVDAATEYARRWAYDFGGYCRLLEHFLAAS
jgi:hypothetical protein